MTDEWGSVLDSINNKKNKADKAARAMAAQQPAPAAAPAPTTDPAICELQKAMLAMAAQVTELAAAVKGAPPPTGGGGGRRQPRTFAHPLHEKCGRHHSGGDAGCWILNPGKCPASMADMLSGIHAKRKALKLPDLSGQYKTAADLSA